MQIEPLGVPITSDDEGVLRVGNSRVTVDVIVAAYDQGATAEELVQDFPTLSLADVYAVLTYYLKHSETIEKYLSRRREEAQTLQQRFEAHTDVQRLRERLRARLRS